MGPEMLRGDAEAARRYRVTRRTIIRWRHAGMPHVLVGRVLLIPVAEADAWLLAHRRGEVPAPDPEPAPRRKAGRPRRQP